MRLKTVRCLLAEYKGKVKLGSASIAFADLADLDRDVFTDLIQRAADLTS